MSETLSARERQLAIERQLDTEELHAQLGRTGLKRLLRPIKTARIVATVANRRLSGQYDPRLTERAALRSPFDDDPNEDLHQGRSARQNAPVDSRDLPAWKNPFDEDYDPNDPQTVAARAEYKAAAHGRRINPFPEG